MEVEEILKCMKEEIYKKMCAYYVTNETQLIKFEKFYNDYINDNNFKAVFISEYNDVYTLFKDEFNEIFTKARIDTTDVLLQNMASNIKETRQRNDAIYVTLREMANNTKENRKWTRFFGIVVIISMIIYFFRGIKVS